MQQRVDLDQKLMVSLDIESLFTNVPVNETIDIILSKLFIDDSCLYHGFNRKDFQTLLQSVNDSYFSFDNELYKQTEGMSMGSPSVLYSLISFCLIMNLNGYKTRQLNPFFIDDMLTIRFGFSHLTPIYRLS